MERNFYNDDFERLIRQKADQYKMYPSDQVWKGIFKSLHGRRRWHWAGLAVLLLGLGLYTGNYYLAGKPANKIARNIEPSLNAATDNSSITSDNSTLASDRNDPTATENTSNAGTIDANTTTADNTVAGNTTPISNRTGAGSNRSGSLTQQSASLTAMSNRQQQNNTIDNNTTFADALGGKVISINARTNNNTTAPFIANNTTETSGIIVNDPAGLNSAVTNNLREKTSRNTDIAVSVKDANAKVEQSKLSVADAASESVLDEQKQGVNWLQDYAVFQLTGNRPKRLGLQIYFSPTVNYRKLTGSSYFPSSEVKSIPLSPNIMGDVDQYVKHKPALGFEVGANLLYRTSRRISYKAGLQFNYSRYNIQAYEGLPEVATIALSNSVAFQADTISALSNIRNLSGYEQEELSNQYFQVSMPIGLEFRVIGTDKLQLNVAGTIQPTYLINRNSYLITTDYKNYMREPSLVRRWNVNGGLETYVSYNTGTVRWQVGPQVRYQFFSTYSKKYPIKERLMEYGFKIAVSRTFQ